MSFPPPSAEQLLRGYAGGIFPMADGRGSPNLHWIDPDRRGVFPLDGYHLSRSTRRTIRRARFGVTFDRDFTGVMQGCAARDETWINDTIVALCHELFAAGHAHSIEIWDGAELVGGVYGVTVGAAFFGESMFSRRADASKVALAYLIDRLRSGGFRLFDTQFLTPHLASIGAVEISRARYLRRLHRAINQKATFGGERVLPTPDQILQRMTQTS